MSKSFGVGKHFLFVAHPGHELCVYGWLERTKPRVFVLTDGSGRSGSSRIDSTTRVLKQAGAEPGSIYGRLTDPEIYRAILGHDFGVFWDITNEFAEVLVREQADSVTGDAIEGFNPAHDVCRLIINAAVEIAQRVYGLTIRNSDFLLVGRHELQPEEMSAAMRLELDNETFRRKLELARAFYQLKPEIDAALDGELQALRQYPELSADLTLQYNSLGSEAYRIECLRPAAANGRDFNNQPPFYERYGELRVAEGSYEDVIRYDEHVLPIAEALQKLVEDRALKTVATAKAVSG